MSDIENVIMTKQEFEDLSVGLTKHVMKELAAMINESRDVLQLLSAKDALDTLVESLLENSGEQSSESDGDRND